MEMYYCCEFDFTPNITTEFNLVSPYHTGDFYIITWIRLLHVALCSNNVWLFAIHSPPFKMSVGRNTWAYSLKPVWRSGVIATFQGNATPQNQE